MEKNGIWSEEFVVRAFTVDRNRQMTLPALGNFLQEVAGNHANFRKIGYFEMQKANRFWALNRMRIEMTAFPMWRETIKISTWVDTMKGPFSYRNFQIFNSNGKEIGSATTLWLSVDITKRRPARIIETQMPILEGKIAACGHPNKLGKQIASKIPTLRTVEYSDLDMIGHVNNVKYLEWVLNSYGTREGIGSPYFFEVNFINETHFGSTVEIHTYPIEEKIFQHSLRIGANVLTRIILKWK